MNRKIESYRLQVMFDDGETAEDTLTGLSKYDAMLSIACVFAHAFDLQAGEWVEAHPGEYAPDVAASDIAFDVTGIDHISANLTCDLLGNDIPRFMLRATGIKHVSHVRLTVTTIYEQQPRIR